MLAVRYLVLMVAAVSRLRTSDVVPLILLDYDAQIQYFVLDNSPFNCMTSDRFYNVMDYIVRKCSRVIFFIETTLNVEDITKRDQFGGMYMNIERRIKMQRAMYLPGVENPYQVLKQTFPERDDNTFALRYEAWNVLRFEAHKYLYVYFEDFVNETRNYTLRRHDIIMENVYQNLRDHVPGPVMAIYSGMRSEKYMEPVFERRRKKRAPVQMFTVESSRALVRLHALLERTALRTRRLHEVPHMVDQPITNRNFAVRLFFNEFEINFDFIQRNHTWTLSYVTLMENGTAVGRTRLDATAAWGQSYYCDYPIDLPNRRTGAMITIPHYQVQPFRQGSHSPPNYRPVKRARPRDVTKAKPFRRPLKKPRTLFLTTADPWPLSLPNNTSNGTQGATQLTTSGSTHLFIRKWRHRRDMHFFPDFNNGNRRVAYTFFPKKFEMNTDQFQIVKTLRPNDSYIFIKVMDNDGTDYVNDSDDDNDSNDGDLSRKFGKLFIAKDSDEQIYNLQLHKISEEPQKTNKSISYLRNEDNVDCTPFDFAPGKVYYSNPIPIVPHPSCPDCYARNSKCATVIRGSPTDSFIEITFVGQFFLEQNGIDYLTLRDGDNEEAPLIARLVGANYPSRPLEVLPGPFRSTGPALWMQFMSNEGWEFSGFTFKVTFISTTTTSTTTTSTTTTSTTTTSTTTTSTTTTSTTTTSTTTTSTTTTSTTTTSTTSTTTTTTTTTTTPPPPPVTMGKDFGPAVNCSNWSIGMLMGMMASAVMLTGLAIGVFMMLSIETPDRFDDPNQVFRIVPYEPDYI